MVTHACFSFQCGRTKPVVVYSRKDLIEWKFKNFKNFSFFAHVSPTFLFIFFFNLFYFNLALVTTKNSTTVHGDLFRLGLSCDLFIYFYYYFLLLFFFF